jgi:hypothetical protein
LSEEELSDAGFRSESKPRLLYLKPQQLESFAGPSFFCPHAKIAGTHSRLKAFLKRGLSLAENNPRGFRGQKSIHPILWTPQQL